MQWLGLTSGEFLLALLGFGGAVVALYLLRQEQRRVSVPALALWQGLLKERQSAALERRLRRIFSLLLALAIVLLLLLGLADLRTQDQAGGRRIVLMIDRSASMAALDEAPSRLERAKQLARELVDGLGPADRAIVVALDTQATPRSGWSGELRELREAIDTITPSDLAGDLAAGVRLALDVARGQPSPELVLLSDGGLAARDEAQRQLSEAARLTVRYQRVGKLARNLAITEFSVRRYPLERTRQECIVTLSNFGPSTEQVALSISAAGAPLHEEDLTLAPGAHTTRALTDLTAVDALLEARIVPRAGADVLPSDDRAFATLPARAPIRVLLVTRGNRYLEAALLLDELLEVREQRPEDYRGAGGFDVVVFDAYRPPEQPGVPALYLGLGSGAGTFPLRSAGELARPFFERVDAKHPVVRFTALRDVNIAKAARVEAEPGDLVIASTETRAPLLVEGRRAARFLALTFDVRESDLALRPAWPLLLLGSLEHLTARDDRANDAHTAGTPIRVPLPEALASATLTAPGQPPRELRAAGGQVRFTPEHAGVYTLVSGALAVPLAVNVPAAEEGAIEPAERVLGQPAVAPRAARQGALFGERPWPVFLGAALLLLVLEWWTYHRRWTV